MKNIKKSQSNPIEESFEMIGDRIKYLLHLANINLRQLSEKYNLPIGTLKYWSSSRMQITQSSAEKLTAVFAREGIICSVDWLMRGKGERPEKLELIKQHSSKLYIEKQLQLYLSQCKKPVSMVIADESMAPFFSAGDIVAGDASLINSLDDLENSVCLLQDTMKKTSIGVLHSEKQGYSLTFCNPEFKNHKLVFDPTEIIYIAPVIWIYRSKHLLSLYFS